MTHKSHIEKLIQEMCPNGVPSRTLGEVCDFKRGSIINAKTAIEGDIPVIAGGLKPAYYHNKSNRAGETITIAGSGAYAGYVAYWKQPIFVSDAFSIEPKNISLLNTKYLYYCLIIKQDAIYQTKTKGGIPHVRPSSIDRFFIPLPPLPIQEEIVRILDAFSKLIENIDAEIDARQRQLSNAIECLYNDVKDNWLEKSLSDIGQIIKGSGILKSDFVEVGRPCIHYGQIHTYYTTYAKKTKSFISEKLFAKCKKAKTGDLVIATTSEDVPACCKATAWLGKEDVAVSGDAHILHHNQDPLFMAYLFRTERFSEQRAMAATGAKVTRVSGDRLASFRFFFPPIAEQRAIAEKLDTIEAFINNLKTERDLRQQQYEYYREHLINLLK